MDEQSIRIRTAKVEDAKDILKIYGYYVENTAITYEYETPSLEEFQQRIENTLKTYPYLVAEQDGKIVGYAYAGRFHARAAFDWCAEVTVYLDKNMKKCGLGRKLYNALEEILKQMGVINLYALIAYPEEEDEYLNKNSAQFHEHMGYTLIGTAHNCGYKFGRWYHMIWMEKVIGEYQKEQAQAPIKRYTFL